jgi:hypothetical protein
MQNISYLWEKVHTCDNIPPRCSHTATYISNQIYIIGGGAIVVGSVFTQFNDVWIWNPISRKINLLICHGSLFTARRGHTACAHRDKHIYVFGGILSDQTFSNDLYILDTTTSSWNKIAAAGIYPTARRGHGASIYNDKMYIIGGDSRIISSEVFILCLVSHTWSSVIIQSIPYQLSLSCWQSYGSMMVCFGGTYLDDVQTELSNTFYVFDMATLHWKEFAKGKEASPEGRYCAGSAILLQDNNAESAGMLVWGGNGRGNSWPKDFIQFPLHMSTIHGPHNILDYSLKPAYTSIHQESPTFRNGMTLTSFRNETVFMFGGGVFPYHYSNECWLLHVLPPVTSFCSSLTQSRASADSKLTGHDEMFKYFAYLYENSIFCDVLIKANSSRKTGLLIANAHEKNSSTEYIRAHRVVLTSRCPFFRNLLEGVVWKSCVDDTESDDTSSSLPILELDVSSQALHQALRWIYTNQMPSEMNSFHVDDFDTIISFLEICDMMGLQVCKEYCEMVLGSALSWPKTLEPGDILGELVTTLRIANVADSFGCSKLFDAVLNHVNKLVSILRVTMSWETHDVNGHTISCYEIVKNYIFHMESDQSTDTSIGNGDMTSQKTHELITVCVDELAVLSPTCRSHLINACFFL